MLTPDDERTLQVLEAVAWHYQTAGEIFAMCDTDDDKSLLRELASQGLIEEWEPHRGFRVYGANFAGRAKLAELREKKGRGE